MKVKVLKKFRDKETREIHNKGDVFEATEERVAEIKQKDSRLVEVVEEKPKQEAEKEAEKEPEKEPEQGAAGVVCDIAQMTEEQLRELAKSRKIKGHTKMSEDELREALEQ